MPVLGMLTDIADPEEHAANLCAAMPASKTALSFQVSLNGLAICTPNSKKCFLQVFRARLPAVAGNDGSADFFVGHRVIAAALVAQ